MYIGTLTLSLVMAVFGAVLLALVLGDQIARPLVMLAQGVRQVAAGDLTPKMALQGNDELVGLTRAFASMTEQVADARRKVDTARAHLQAILDNLTAGVMVVDSDGKIRSANPGAAQILQCDVTTLTGRNLSEIEGLNQLEEFTEQGQEHFQRTIEIPSQHARSSAFDRPLALMVRGATLPSQERLLVFDDISDIVSAQRAQAWGEVARRLAHEIKNPLTPIQLSAERLERRLTGKLQEADQQVLTKSVKTIVEQVESMKRLVNDFRDYARLPSAQLQPVDLNALLVDVMQLYEYEGQQTLHIDWELDAQCPLIRGDAQQLRQVIHNIVQNAQDVSDKIVIRTVNRPASERVRLMVLDWGSGFPPDILKTAFEAKGTGLGLAVVKKIADEHAARIDISNRVEQGVTVGAQVSLSFAYHSQQAVATAA
jgi:PAS domain S-box-containing protein